MYLLTRYLIESAILNGTQTDGSRYRHSPGVMSLATVSIKARVVLHSSRRQAPKRHQTPAKDLIRSVAFCREDAEAAEVMHRKFVD